MKKHILDFLRRGLLACGFGPLALAAIYLVLQGTIDLSLLSVNEAVTGILSLYALAFIAGGMNFIYQIERLPLMVAILIHGAVLYVSYLCTYLLNSWLEWNVRSLLVFTGIFVIGYVIIWAIICSIIRKNTEKINSGLKKIQSLE
jgi:hypothetical protein